MDSITQIVLGAAVGEAVCGKRAGNHALLWGAVAGTIPDLDILASPFQDLVQQLTFHRGITHSIFFAAVTSPVFAWLFKKWYKKSKVTYSDWFWLFFLGFTTHAILDSFTTWGTKLFYPFSDYAVSFHNIFVIDPLYTVPFLLCLIMVMFYKRTDVKRRYWNYAGIAISSFYICITIVNKFSANRVFEENFASQNIDYIQYSSKPTPFNSILWCATAETKDGFYIGHYSLLDKDKKVEFAYFEKKHELLDEYRNNEKLVTLLGITEGYFIVRKEDDALVINDLRFGQLDGWDGGKEDFVFSYLVKEVNGKLEFSQKPNDLKKARQLMPQLWSRVLGNS
ncbi:MAG: metal-dependent hydrolase [Cytophagaceae bacterium]